MNITQADIIAASAVELKQKLAQGQITVTQLLDALEQQWLQVDGCVHALPTTGWAGAKQDAAAIDQQELANTCLAGLPVAIKDLTQVAGMRTTHGSLVYKDLIPEQSDPIVQLLESRGGVVYAKSNSPEFGAGGNTFNEVFPATSNPYDQLLSAGGSSGGAAAALASGTAWLAQGSDLAGSLRTPAAFCGVTSLRPTPGLIRDRNEQKPGGHLGQDGPMARDLSDLALFAEAMCLQPHDGCFTASLESPQQPVKIAYSLDLGITQVDAAVASCFSDLVSLLSKSGSNLQQNQPCLDNVDQVFDVLRAYGYTDFKDLSAEQKSMMKPEVQWNVRYGEGLTEAQVQQAHQQQKQLVEQAHAFMQDYDLLILPATIVASLPLSERYLGYSDGVPIEQYYRWLRIVYAITVLELPVITIPMGKTEDDLPLGVQLVGQHGAEEKLFAHAAYITKLLDLAWVGKVVPVKGG